MGMGSKEGAFGLRLRFMLGLENTRKIQQQ